MQLLSEKGPLKIQEQYILVMEQPAPSPPAPLRGGRAGSRRCENMVQGVLTGHTHVLVLKCQEAGGHDIYTGENHKHVYD